MVKYTFNGGSVGSNEAAIEEGESRDGKEEVRADWSGALEGRKATEKTERGGMSAGDLRSLPK